MAFPFRFHWGGCSQRAPLKRRPGIAESHAASNVANGVYIRRRYSMILVGNSRGQRLGPLHGSSLSLPRASLSPASPRPHSRHVSRFSPTTAVNPSSNLCRHKGVSNMAQRQTARRGGFHGAASPVASVSFGSDHVGPGLGNRRARAIVLLGHVAGQQPRSRASETNRRPALVPLAGPRSVSPFAGDVLPSDLLSAPSQLRHALFCLIPCVTNLDSVLASLPRSGYGRPGW